MTNEAYYTFAVILFAGGAATVVWRFLGVIYSDRLRVGSPMLSWVKAVATALIAALVIRMVVDPPGHLAESALASRVLALTIGSLVFLFVKRIVALGVAAAVFVFLVAELLRGA